MFKRLALAALFTFSLAACATTPEDGENNDTEAKKEGHCTKVHEVGSRKPVEVCR